ncbi:MAG: hypothetical protein HZA90_07300 [Verrucomicrobia bacterium]|nr:hypothetical protein [Verrucomicrobiota bacterium]
MVNFESTALWVWVFGILFVLGAGFTIFSRWCYNSPAAPVEKVNKLRLGMHMADVRRLLGDPVRERAYEDLPEWQFGHRLKNFVLIVRFNEDGHVREFYHFRPGDPGKPVGN